MKTNKYCLAAIAILVLAGAKADFGSAINTNTREDEDSAAEVRYYEPSKCNLNDSLGRGTTGEGATEGLSTHQAEWVDRWYETAQQLSVEFGIPWEAVMAQSIIESGAGTSYYATTRNNFFGLGAVDSNPDNAYCCRFNKIQNNAHYNGNQGNHNGFCHIKKNPEICS